MSYCQEMKISVMWNFLKTGSLDRKPCLYLFISSREIQKFQVDSIVTTKCKLYFHVYFIYAKSHLKATPKKVWHKRIYNLQFCMCVHSKLGARKTISSIVKLHVPKSNSIPFSENWHTSKNVCKLITNYIFNTILAMIQIILHNILSY